jgi:hypothetical protein
MADSVAEARQEVELARHAVESELDDLGTSARAAVDIPAKVRANPVRTIGIGAGAAFLLLGGPRRALKAAEKRVLPRRRPRQMLPDEIERSLKNLPEGRQEEVRAHLERDFAAYVRREHTKEQPNARRSIWGTYDTVVGIVGAAAARELVKKFFGAPEEAKREEAVKAVEQVAQAESKARRRRKSG